MFITCNGKRIHEIMTNHSMCLDEAIDIAGESHWNEEEEYQEVIINGESYDYDDLDMEW